MKVFFARTHANLNSLVALASALERHRGCEHMRIVPWRMDREPFPCLEDATDPVVVLWSFTTAYLIETAKKLQSVRSLLGKSSPVIMVAGGPHPTAAPEETLKMGFDYVIRGEGESSLPAFLLAIAQGRSPFSVTGVCGYDEGQLMLSRLSDPAPFEQIPPFAPRHKLAAMFEITRGCPMRCQFCQTSYIMGTTPRHRPVASIVEAISWAITQNHYDIRFICPDALAFGSITGRPNLQHIRTLFAQIRGIDPKIRIFFGSFPSEINPLSISPEALSLIREYCANDTIVIGLQSGSDRMLKRMHRAHTVKQVLSAIGQIVQAGFTPCVDLIFGLPGEGPEDLEQTFQVIHRLTDLGAIIHSHTFMPLPGTPWANQQPSEIPNAIIDELERLTGSGRHFGQWQRQRELNRRIATFRRYLKTSGVHA
ncbi:MAG: TIGR04013 family B12-binding domain/radical SAM domain-containing protein, partial [Lentisphaerae bacterium]